MSNPSLPQEPGLLPIERCLDSWHTVVAGNHQALGALVADNAVLHSPIVFTPQRGKELVILYLRGASLTFGGAGAGTVGTAAPGEGAGFTDPEGRAWDGRFRYVRTVLGTHDAVLEFETTMDGKYVNGVDMIRCDDEGLIIDFKVMIRPLQAVHVVHELMRAALETLRP